MKMNLKLKFFLLIICLFSLNTLTFAAASPISKDVEAAYQNWCRAIGVAKGNPAVVVKYYAPKAILLPTLSPKIMFNLNSGLDAYFKGFTAHQDIQCTTNKLITQVYGDIAINSGLYTFTYTDDSKNRVVIPARFTFVYQKLGSEWLIVNHHSSKIPV